MRAPTEWLRPLTRASRISSVALLHLKNRLRLRLRAVLTDPALRLQRPQRAGSQDEDRLRVLLAVEAEGNLSPYGRRFTHFVKGLSGVEGRGSPPGSGSGILLQPLRNHDTPKNALNGNSPPLRLVLDPAELMAVIFDLEGGRAPSLRRSRFLRLPLSPVLREPGTKKLPDKLGPGDSRIAALRFAVEASNFLGRVAGRPGLHLGFHSGCRSIPTIL